MKEEMRYKLNQIPYKVAMFPGLLSLIHEPFECFLENLYGKFCTLWHHKIQEHIRTGDLSKSV